MSEKKRGDRKTRRQKVAIKDDCRAKSRTWKLLDDSDIEHVLEVTGRKLDLDAKLMMRRLINEQSARWGECRRWRRENLPHKLLEKLRKLRDDLAAVHADLKDYRGINQVLAREHDRLTGHPCSVEPASIEKLQSEFPNLSREWLVAAHGIISPSDEAMGKVLAACMHMNMLRRLTESAEKTELRRQARLGTKEKPQRKDNYRYGFIVSLATIYMRIFGRSPTTSLYSEWCCFLAAVLSVAAKVSN